MSAFLGPQALAPAASTGNNNHTSMKISPVPQLVCVEFVVEVAGATPTIGFKLQETFDADSVADGAALWADLILLPSDSDTAAVTRTVTAVGAFIQYIAQSQIRFAKRVRLVTSANTNITYHANLHSQYRN